MGFRELGLILNVSVAVVDVLAIGSLRVDLRAMLVHPGAHQHAQTLLHRLLVELGVGGDHSRCWQGGCGVDRRGGAGIVTGTASFLTVAIQGDDRVPLDVAIVQVSAHDVHMRVVTVEDRQRNWG